MQGLSVRAARPGDLPALEAFYRRVVAAMDASGVCIWSEDYPYPAVVGDVAAGEFFVAEKSGALAGAYQLGSRAANCDAAAWREPRGRALYLGRLAIEPEFWGAGLGRALCRDAALRARGLGADWLRLFVVDVNAPAVRLYEACGFRKCSGIFQLDLGHGVLHEYPYELDLSGKIG